MTTTTYEKLKKELKDELLHELNAIITRRLKDPEGEYRASFIKKMLKRAQSNGPFYKFSGKKSFLSHVRPKK